MDEWNVRLIRIYKSKLDMDFKIITMQHQFYSITFWTIVSNPYCTTNTRSIRTCSVSKWIWMTIVIYNRLIMKTKWCDQFTRYASHFDFSSTSVFRVFPSCLMRLLLSSRVTSHSIRGNTLDLCLHLIQENRRVRVLSEREECLVWRQSCAPFTATFCASQSIDGYDLLLWCIW